MIGSDNSFHSLGAVRYSLRLRHTEHTVEAVSLAYAFELDYRDTLVLLQSVHCMCTVIPIMWEATEAGGELVLYGLCCGC